MESIDLAREGFPNYQLFSNGTVINKKTNSPLTLVGGRYAELWQDGKCRSFSVAMLLRRYFHNELKELPEDQVVNRLHLMEESGIIVLKIGCIRRWVKVALLKQV